MAKEIIWSHKAKIKLYAILEFYNNRNKSKTYSIKLYKLFKKELKHLHKNPELGVQSSIENIRGLIVSDYIIYYEITDENIIIHTIWPTNQNPEDNKIA